MTNWLAAGLVLPHAAIISLRGSHAQRGRGATGENGSGGTALTENVAEANASIEQLTITLFSTCLAVSCVFSASAMTI